MHIGIVFTLVILQACSSTKKQTRPSTSTIKKTIFEQIDKNTLTNQWVQYQSTVKVESPDFNGQFSLKTKLKANELIWMSIKKLNIEGARIQIRPDYIEMLDRQQSLYRKRQTEQLSKEWGLGFDQIQNIFLNHPILFDEKQYLIRQSSSQIILQSKSKNTVEQHIFLNKNTQQIDSTHIKVGETRLSVSFEEYSLENNKWIPKKWHIALQTNLQNTKLDVVHKRCILDKESRMSFSIPDFYKREID